MTTRRLTPATVPEVPAAGGQGEPASRAAGVAAALPAALVLLLLLAATIFDGGFQIRHWAPVALLALAMLAVTVAAGGVAALPAWARLALAGAWGLAVWSLLSGMWSSQPGVAFEQGNRAVLYAALISIPLLTPVTRRQLRVLGHALVAGLVLIALITLGRILIEGTGVFLAGRLDAPIGYRNATAALFALAVWPLVCLAAPQGGNPAIRAACVSGAVLSLGLAFLTQSRGMLVGIAAGALAVLVLGPDRIRRAWLGVLVIGLVAAASPLLLAPYDAFDGGQGTVADSDVFTAGRGLLLASAAGFAVGLLLFLFDNGLRASAHLRARRLAAVALAGGALVAGGGALAAVGNPVDFGQEKLDEFRSLETSTTAGSTRLGTVSGQRYDLWRVAWNEFSEHPVAGAGVGGYETAYYRERRTDRNLNDPHSLPLSILAETGVIGFGFFAALLAGLLWPLAAAVRRRADRDLRVAAGLAAAGVTLVAQTFVDWLTLIPGVTGLGLFALALAAAMVTPERTAARGRPRGFRFLGAAALSAATVGVMLLFLSDLYVRDARELADAGAVQSQLDAAETAAALNPWALQPLWLQASAHESMGDVEAARAKLREALDQQPESFPTLALLGDLEARAGNVRPAREHYRGALELNPRDVGLQELAAGRFGG